jgi:hypothetical protein
MIRSIQLLPLLALCLLCGGAKADTYKWVDEKGNVTYSDQAPPLDAKQTETIKQSHSANPVAAAPSAAPAAAKQKSIAEQEMDFKKRRVEAAEAEAKKEKEAVAAEEKRKNCEHARNQVKLLESGGRITKIGANGETIFLEDQEIPAELRSAKRNAEAACG